MNSFNESSKADRRAGKSASPDVDKD